MRQDAEVSVRGAEGLGSPRAAGRFHTRVHAEGLVLLEAGVTLGQG